MRYVTHFSLNANANLSNSTQFSQCLADALRQFVAPKCKPCGMPHATQHRNPVVVGVRPLDYGVSPFWGPSKSLGTLRCRDYLVRLRLQGIGGLERTTPYCPSAVQPSVRLSGQFSRLAINAIRRTIVRHAKRGRTEHQNLHKALTGQPRLPSRQIVKSGGRGSVCVFITQMSNYLTKDLV